MPSSLFSLNLGTVAAAVLASLIGTTTAHFNIDTSFKIDVHSHAIPSRWYNALIEAGYPVTNGTLYVDKFPVSGTWDITSHLAAMDTNGLNYSTLSVSAPGVTFLYDDAAAALQLAQLINDEMYNYTQQYPDRLGAMCLLPLPHINESLTEIARCLDCLNFDGIGMYTNFHGLYLGNRTLDPIMSLIEEKNATIFVHPSAPSCAGAAIGYPDPMSEYPFDSVRAMENLLLAGQRAAFPDINIIFPHGGGAMPYLGGRIAGISSLSFLGGLSVATSVAQFQNYFFDTASATSVVQLVAMNAFGGIKKIVTGTDYPYVPLVQSTPALAAIQTNGGYTDDEMALINNQNVLGIFPRIVAKLGLTSSSNTTTV